MWRWINRWATPNHYDGEKILINLKKKKNTTVHSNDCNSPLHRSVQNLRLSGIQHQAVNCQSTAVTRPFSPSLLESAEVMSDSEPSRKGSKRQQLRTEATVHPIQWPTSCNILRTQQYGAMGENIMMSPEWLMGCGPVLPSGCHIWFATTDITKVTMYRRWPQGSVRPPPKCRCCFPLRSRRWNTFLCQWTKTRALPFAFL